MADYKLRIVVEGEDKASGPLGSVGGSLQRIGEFAAGGLLANGISAIGRSLVDLGGQALDSYASNERLSMSLNSLVAREMVATSGTEKYINVGQQRLQLSDKERAKLGELQMQYDKTSATLAVQREHLQEAINKGKESSAEIQLRQVRIAELEQKLGTLGGAIDQLKGKDGALVNVTKKVIEGQMTMGQAMQQAGPRARELLGWIQQLAIQSPFNQEDIANAFRMTLAYGFTTKETQRLTQAMVDFTAGTGASGAVMNRVALALGQIKARGHVAGQELNQLSEAGINAREILAEAFGVSTEQLMKMVEKGLVPADKAIEAITSSLEKDFGGAAKAQANTMSGLLASLEDIKSIGLRELFSGTFEALQPILERVVGVLSDPKTMDTLRNIGDIVGDKLKGGLDAAADSFDTFFAKFAQYEPSVQSFMAALGSATGAQVNVQDNAPIMPGGVPTMQPVTAEVVSVNWGTFTYTYNANTAITTINWGDFGYTYNANTKITTVDWTQALGTNAGYTYSAEAGVTEVHWHEDGFNFAYNYQTKAGITEVAWGVYTNTYSATTSITSVLWGVYTTVYDSGSRVSSVAWGAYTTEYNASAKIESSSVLWGAWTNTYQSTTKIDSSSVLWGAWTHTYDSQGSITSVLWGLFSWTYDVKANASVFTIGGKTPGQAFSDALTAVGLPSWTWPALPAFLWPALPVWAWPAYVAWVWPSLPGWTWPALPSFSWPAIPKPSWNWPSIPAPAWLNTLLSAVGISGNAGGTSYWRGGLTWVGEKGPELVNLSRGAQVLNHERSMAYAGAGGGVTVNIYAQVASDIDVQSLAHRVASVIRSRR